MVEKLSQNIADLALDVFPIWFEQGGVLLMVILGLGILVYGAAINIYLRSLDTTHWVKSLDSYRVEDYQRAIKAQIVQDNQSLYMLLRIIAAAPLLGLLGTVIGMIEAFGGLGSASGEAMLSSGISSALLSTQTGIVVAIVGIVLLKWVSSRVQQHSQQLISGGEHHVLPQTR